MKQTVGEPSLAYHAEEAVNLLVYIAEQSIVEDRDDSTRRYLVEPELDTEFLQKLLAFLSKIGRHP